MSDLISRNAVIDIIHKEIERTTSFAEHQTQINIEMAVKELPIAYDVDKVVEELEDRKKLHERLVHYETKNGTVTEKYQHIKAIDVLNDAIEIVKQGGVYDDVCEWRLCDEEANVYDTSCRNPHILITGTPEENNYEYCPYCGKKIKVVE